MGKAMEVLTGYVTAVGTTLTAITMLAGNSLTIRAAREGSKVWLIGAWANAQADGYLQIRSPRLHDNVEGMTFAVESTNCRPLIPIGIKQELISQDTLIAMLAGSATAGDIDTACLLVYYEDLPGVEGRFITYEELMERGKNLISVRNTLTLDTDGTYDAEEAINAEYDLLKANTDYAILGAHVRDNTALIRYRGTDTGNLGVGVPGGIGEQWISGAFFMHMAKFTGLACIPVFNSANKSNMLIDGCATENDVTEEVSTNLMELR